MRNPKRLNTFPLSCALLACTAFAQTPAPVSGAVANRVTGAGIGGATVTFFTPQAVRYQAITDDSGAFRIAAIDPGVYEAMVEKSGFVLFPKEPVQVQSAPVRLRYEMQFGRTQQAKLSGRVLTSQDKPAAGVQVELIHGPELRTRTTADANGRFAFDKLSPGPYELRAIPAQVSSEGQPRKADIATYFPSSLEEKDAQRIVVRGDTTVDGFWLQNAPVFRVQGRILDDTGAPAAKASVSLVAMTRQPAHVISSFDSYFTAIDEGSAPGSEEGHVIAADDGRFEFPSVRAADWRIVAEAAPRIDPQSGFNLAPSGVAHLFVQGDDVQNIEVRLDALFALGGSGRWPVAQCHVAPRNPSCVIDSRTAPEGTGYPVWLHGLEGQPSTLNVGVLRADATFQIPGVHPGHYLLQPLPLLPNPAMPKAGHARDYSPPSLSQTKLVLDLGSGAEPIEPSGGGYFDPDGNRPVYTPVLAGPGSVKGTVDNGGNAAVVFLPETYSQGSLGLLVYCQPDGTYNANRLAAGMYYVAAFRGLDMESLRDPEVLHRVLAASNKVQVVGDEAAELNLAASPWPE